MGKFFKLITYIFHPIFMPLLGVYLAVTADGYLSFIMQPEFAIITYLILALSTIVFPLISIFLLFKSGLISSFQIESRKERIRPFISTLVYYFLGYYLLRRGALPLPIYSMLIGTIISLMFVIIISLKWKISAHSTGVFGVLGMLCALSLLYGTLHPAMILIMLMAGAVVMSARLYTNSHNPAQVYSGAFLGFVCCFVPVLFQWFI